MMAAMRLQAIAIATDAELRGGDREFNGVSTDSRQTRPGDLFVALRGEHFDGNEFVPLARKNGAVAAIVSDWVAGDCADLPQLRVADTRRALGEIGAVNRQASAARVVAITGSNGKTSCKTMVASILSARAAVLATEGNFNNEVGVPLTLLRIAPQHRYAVVELGAARAGDIAYLCRFAKPDVVLLTNASGAHLEGFGDIETVVKTKGEILDDLPTGGAAVINFDSPWYGQWSARAKNARRFSFSLENSAADFYAGAVRCTDDLHQHFSLHCAQGVVDIDLPVPGLHMVANALASAAAAMAAGAELADVKTGLEKLTPVAGRLAVTEVNGIRVIDDSYNANPQSVCAAIDLLATMSGRRVLVLGAMAELGPDSVRLHVDVAAYAREQGIDRLLVVGVHATAQAAAFGDGGDAFADKEALTAALEAELDSGDSVLVKGSRSSAMDTVVSHLLAAAGERIHSGGVH